MSIIQDNPLIKRSSKEHINQLLKSNPNWNILDIGCGYDANILAKVICDIQDLSAYYKDKKFIKLDPQKKTLPFKDKEFDFVIASHVIEHVENVENFIGEIERISKQGYIELPTKLEDNLVFENKNDHLWHMDFDDINSKLEISPKVQVLEPILTVSSMKKMHQFFRKSFVLELYWQDKIEYVLLNKSKNVTEKISLLNLFKKFFSKKTRMMLK